MAKYGPVDGANVENFIDVETTDSKEEAKRSRLKKIKVIFSIVASIATILGVVLGVYFNVNRNNSSNSNEDASVNNSPTINNTQAPTNSRTTGNAEATTHSPTSTRARTTSSLQPSSTSDSASPTSTCTNGGGVQVQIMQSGWCMTDWYYGACGLAYPKSGATSQQFTQSFSNWKVGGCLLSAGVGQDTWFKVSCNNGPWVDGRCTLLYSDSKDCLAVWDDGWNYNPGSCSHFQNLTQPI